MLKRLGILLCLLLAASFLTVAQAEVASASHRYRCFNNHRDTWVGTDNIHPVWDNDARLARVEIDYHVCIHRRGHKAGMIAHKKSRFTMGIYRNGYAASAGVHFGHNKARRDPYGDTADFFGERMYIHGWWNECIPLLPKSPATCGPTGDFTYVWRFAAPWAVKHHHDDQWYLYRRAGEPFKSPGPYDSFINFYNSPS